jgi:hypothetical protein
VCRLSKVSVSRSRPSYGRGNIRIGFERFQVSS